MRHNPVDSPASVVNTLRISARVIPVLIVSGALQSLRNTGIRDLRRTALGPVWLAGVKRMLADEDEYNASARSSMEHSVSLHVLKSRYSLATRPRQRCQLRAGPTSGALL